jgi:hypothetical protein
MTLLTDDDILDAYCVAKHDHQFVSAFHAGARWAEARVIAALAQRAGTLPDAPVLLHVTETDEYPDIAVQVRDGENIQPSASPIAVYTGVDVDAIRAASFSAGMAAQDYALRLLIAGGFVTQEKADEARNIARRLHDGQQGDPLQALADVERELGLDYTISKPLKAGK